MASIDLRTCLGIRRCRLRTQSHRRRGSYIAKRKHPTSPDNAELSFQWAKAVPTTLVTDPTRFLFFFFLFLSSFAGRHVRVQEVE
jgi:hypothetical protein